MSFESVKARKNKPSYGTKLDLWDKLIIGSSENLRIGAPGEIRTPDPLVRSQVLYPAELRALNLSGE